MSNNQLHGKNFESLILTELNIATTLENTAIFDIPLINSSKCAGSIKTTLESIKKTDSTIYLSDATRVWNWSSIINSVTNNDDEPSTIRMIIGIYSQEKEIKQINTVYDINITLDHKTIKELYGEILPEEVYGFHTGLKKEFFPSYEKAREWAKSRKETLEKKGGKIQLNYKIDSTSQRRLQCSIKLYDLLSVSNYITYSDYFLKLELPIKINSGKRIRNKKIDI